MDQIEKLKTIIYQLIGENHFLLDSIECVKRKFNRNNIEIDIVHNRDCAASSQYGRIIIGIPDIVDSYDFSLEYGNLFSKCDNFSLETKYSDFIYSIRNKVNVYISSAEQLEVENQLNKIDFLKGTKLPIIDTLTIYSLTYLLSHEIGHVVLDNDLPDSCQITREKAADYFAFEAIKFMCKTDIDESRLNGAIIGIAQMLMHRTPHQEIDDKEHPHSIERLYSLLDFWGIEDDSPYWGLVYNIVQIWCSRNEEPVTWERATSISPKDKFIDTYVHFRKNPKQIE